MNRVSVSMKEIYYRGTKRFIIDEGSLLSPDNVVLALSVNRELERYGVTLDADAIKALSYQTAAEMSKSLQEMKHVLFHVEGMRDFTAPLFYPNFPEEVMRASDASLYLNSLFFYAFGCQNDKVLNAMAEDFRNSVTENDTDRLPLLENFPRDLRVIPSATKEDLFKMIHARMHSLNMSESQFGDLKVFSREYPKEFRKMLVSEDKFQSKETKVKLAVMLYNEHRIIDVKALLKDTVDVLRFAAMLSYDNGKHQNTVELKSCLPKKDIEFKLNKPQKRLVRDLLNACPGLYEDIWRQERLFKRLMPRLGTTAIEGCPERLVRAFDNLAHNKKLNERGERIFNFDRELGKAIAELNANGNHAPLVALAKNRPGDFLRAYVSSVSKTDPKYREITIDAIKHCAQSGSIPLKNLLTVVSELDTYIEANERMAKNDPIAKIYTHGNKCYVKTNTGLDIPEETIRHMQDTLKNTASEMVKGYQDLGIVYVDPELRYVKAPGREMRGASGGSVLTPYSTKDMDKNKNILIFGVRWEAQKDNPNSRLDVDLSACGYDKDYNDKGHIWYGHLKNEFGVHSGDWTFVHSSGSSTEAVLVDKALMKEYGVRYLAVSVTCFNFSSFKDAGNCRFVMQEREGAMKDLPYPHSNGDHLWRTNNESIRESVMFGEIFEPSHLENCITLSSASNLCTPMLYDVEEDRMYWLDKGIQITTGIVNILNPNSITRAIAEIELAHRNSYPSIADVLQCYVKYNGSFTDDITKADTVFTREHVDREELGIKEDARVISGFDLDIISKEFSGNDDLSLVSDNHEKAEIKEVAEPAIVRQFRELNRTIHRYPHGFKRIEMDMLDGIERS